MRRVSDLARIATVLTLFALLLAACGAESPGTGGTGTTGTTPTPAKKEALKVALVTDIGGLNDNGFNQLSYAGYKKAVEQYGFPERVIQTQSQNDYINNLTLAAQQADLVLAIGFLMQTPLDQIAKQFPNKKFAIVDGCALASGAQECSKLPNVAPLFFKEQEAGCLVGAIAGQMELMGKEKIPKLKGNNTIAAVGGVPVPPVERFIAGYKFCALKVNPNVNVIVNYSNDFVATAKCKDIANSQISQHSADIIFQVAGGCGVGALDAAEQAGVFGIGVDADQSHLHPSVITSALKRVDTSVYSTIDNFQKGQFSNSPPLFDLAHDGVGYAPVTKDVPQEAVAKADEFAAQIKSGELVPPEKIPA